MKEKERGFTLIELLVVIAIIAILASLLLTNLFASRAKAMEAVARADIGAMEQALARYDLDYGTYPESDVEYSSKPLVEALKGDPTSEPRKKQYFAFKEKRLTADGEYLSPLHESYHYRMNYGKPYSEEMHKPDTFDIWTKDSKDNEEGINNWD